MRSPQEPILEADSLFAGVRRRVRLRTRFRSGTTLKHDAELQWWIQEWDPILREGGFNPGDTPGLLDGEPVAPTYLGRRWQQARAEVRRVLREAAIDDDGFFADKVVVDIGPGPLGFPDACPARVSIGIDPLAERFAQHGLLLPDSAALYLSVGAERIPLVSASADVVVARNSLDHVDDPAAVLKEAQRLLAPGGSLILIVDIGHSPTVTEPHALTLEGIRAMLPHVRIVRERQLDQRFGADGRAVSIVAYRD